MTPVEWYYVGGALYMGFEYWLGKTEAVKAGSTLELVVNIVKTVGAVLIKKAP